MRMKTEQTRQRIVDAAYACFWRSGFTRTSIDSIAERAKLTKRTIYSYYQSKDDLLAAVLVHHNDLAHKRLSHIGEQMPTDPDGMVESFFDQLARWVAATPRWPGSGFTKLVVELAHLPGHPARSIARRHKATTEAWLAERLAKASVAFPAERAREIMLLMLPKPPQCASSGPANHPGGKSSLQVTSESDIFGLAVPRGLPPIQEKQRVREKWERQPFHRMIRLSCCGVPSTARPSERKFGLTKYKLFRPKKS